MAAPSFGHFHFVGRCSIFMVKDFMLPFLVGTVLGTLTGLGIGGGSLLIIYLTAFAGFSQENARFVNLAFFIPAGVIACFFRWKKGALTVFDKLPAIIGGCAAALIASKLRPFWNQELMQKGFGVLLIAIGLRELFYRGKK